jgi:hypothetical protein
LTYLLLAILDSSIDELGVFGLLRCGKDEGRIGGGILWLVLLDGYESVSIRTDRERVACSLAKSPESQTTT